MVASKFLVKEILLFGSVLMRLNLIFTCFEGLLSLRMITDSLILGEEDTKCLGVDEHDKTSIVVVTEINE